MTLRGARFEPGDLALTIEGVAPDHIAATLSELQGQGFEIEGVDFRRSTLQDVFLELTGN